MIKQFILLLTLVFASCVSAQDVRIQDDSNFSIFGPKKAAIGQMVVLSIKEDFESVKWLVGNSTQQCFVPPSDPSYCIFSSGRKGSYVFYVVGAKTVGGKIVQSVAATTVVISNDPDVPDPDEPDVPDPDKPDPDDPDPPTPPEPPVVPEDQFDNLGQRLAKHLVDNVSAENVKKYAGEIAGIYNSTSAQIAAGALVTGKVSEHLGTEFKDRITDSAMRTEWQTVMSPWLNKDLAPRWVKWAQEGDGKDNLIAYLKAVAAGVEGAKNAVK